MELFLIYIWLKLDIIGIFAVVISIITGLAACFTFLHCCFENYFDPAYGGESYRMKAERCVTIFKRLLIGACCATAVSVALPSSKETAILVASYFGMEAIKSPEAQKVWTLMRGKANQLLDEEIKKLTPRATN